MKPETTIPIVVGVTGHRALREQDLPALRESVKTELRNIQKLCPHSPVMMLCSLAEGGDLLCADVAEELGIGLIAVLPTERSVFEKDFSPAALERLSHHLSRAEQVFVTPDIEAPPEADGSPEVVSDLDHAVRSFRFRQAGIYVASHCHVLLALWDGGPGTKAACGAAEAVDFALTGNYRPISGAVPHPQGRCGVVHVLAPRKPEAEAGGAVKHLGDWDGLRQCLKRTDDFNRGAAALQDASAGSRPAKTRLPEDASSDPALQKMERLSLAAGRLSTASAKKYRRVLALLAVASSLLTFAFLMYDEAEAYWMILVCGVMLLFAWVCQRYAARSDCHRRYLEYRALAECLRVQTYLRYAGSRVRPVELLTWTQQTETAWIVAALSALEIAGPARGPHDIRGCWVEDQLDYHRGAGARAGHALLSSDRIVRVALLTSITLYVAALAFELLCGGLLSAPRVHLPSVEIWRTVLKIVLGTISAVTLFVSNYYGRLSLPRKESDHRKMEQFFAWITERLSAEGQTEELLTVLAREELIENGNWVSYQRDNKPDLSL